MIISPETKSFRNERRSEKNEKMKTITTKKVVDTRVTHYCTLRVDYRWLTMKTKPRNVACVVNDHVRGIRCSLSLPEQITEVITNGWWARRSRCHAFPYCERRTLLFRLACVNIIQFLNHIIMNCICVF